MGIGNYFEWTIDFEGQRLADNLSHYILIAASSVGFITGYALQSIQITLTIFAIGLFTAALVVLPPWPMYRRHSLQWVQKQD
ncbi:unnamed protein product [Cunninghamella echinulata]